MQSPSTVCTSITWRCQARAMHPRHRRHQQDAEQEERAGRLFDPLRTTETSAARSDTSAVADCKPEEAPAHARRQERPIRSGPGGTR
jgi:hypothetical protein